MPDDGPVLELLQVSPQTYDEIAAILRRADQFGRLATDGVIDLRGMGLVRLERRQPRPTSRQTPS